MNMPACDSGRALGAKDASEKAIKRSFSTGIGWIRMVTSLCEPFFAN